MKRIFNLFIKEHAGKMMQAKILSYQRITIRFNDWVRTAKNEHGTKRFHFKAHTNKHVISKWCKKLGIRERGLI